MSDDISLSDDSDIGDLLAEAEAKRRRTLPTREESGDDSDEDSDDDDGVGSVHLLMSQPRANQQQSVSVKRKLHELTQRKAIRERQRKKARQSAMDSDDDDIDEDDVVPTVMEKKFDNIATELEDSSDEEEPTKYQTTPQLQQTGGAAAITASSKNSAEIIDVENTANHDSSVRVTRSRGAASCRNAPPPRPSLPIVADVPAQVDDVIEVIQTIVLTVYATIKTVLSNNETAKSTAFALVETCTVGDVKAQLLANLQLNSTKSTRDRQSLAVIGLPATATLEATIHCSDVAGTGSIKKKASVVDVGKIIALNLRAGAQETELKIGTKQPLQFLVDAFQSTTSHRIKCLKFDGDTLDLAHTPEQYDMECDDLIDVVVA
jgi:Ubiquitin-2 like Rad60 SUMO-like